MLKKSQTFFASYIEKIDILMFDIKCCIAGLQALGISYRTEMLKINMVNYVRFSWCTHVVRDVRLV